MPRIPDYQSQVQTTVGPQLQQATTAPIESFGGGAALGGMEAATALAGQAAEQFTEIKKQADLTKVMQANNATIKAKNDSLYAPGTGAMYLRGQSAFGATQAYGDKFKNQTDEIAAQLDNDDQRAMYERLRQTQGQELQSQLEKHTLSQAQDFQKEQYSSSIKTLMDDATFNYNVPGKIAQSVGQVRAMAMHQADLDGITDSAMREQRAKDAQSQVYAGVLDRMLAIKDPSAKGFYLGVQESLTAEDRGRLEKTMQTATTQQEAARAADDVLSKNRDLGAAMKAVRAMPYGDVRDQTLTRVKDYFADQKLAEDERDRARFDGAAQMILKSNGRAELTPQQLAGMKPAQIRELHEFRRQTIQGESAPQNSDDYLSLLQMSATDPGKFNQVPLGEYRSKVAPGQWAELAKMQNASRSGESNPDVAGARGLQALITGNIQAMRLDTKNDGDQIKQYTDEVFRRVHEKRTELGRKLTDNEAQAIADTMATPVTVVNRFWNQSTRLFAAPLDKSLKVTVDDIPPQEMRKIREALTIEGKAYSDQAALIKYQLKMGQYRGR